VEAEAVLVAVVVENAINIVMRFIAQ